MPRCCEVQDRLGARTHTEELKRKREGGGAQILVKEELGGDQVEEVFAIQDGTAHCLGGWSQ